MTGLGELDRHLIGEGRHERLWEVLGAQVRRSGDGSPVGVTFTVWAPRAQAVQVHGDFGPATELEPVPRTGLWTGFAPDARPGHRYRLRIRTADGTWRDKADPMAFRTEQPSGGVAVITESRHRWHDHRWLADRDRRSWFGRQVSIYEVHLGSWHAGIGYRRAARLLAGYVAELGFTHVELMPITEHPFGGSWGYQASSYFSPTARFGSPDDFRYLVDVLHQHGIGVILDWVPGHFPKDDWALGRFDGTATYEDPDPLRGEHPDWGTLVFDYGRAEVRNFLVANALYWIEEFHVDGLRVDAVASMLYLDYSRGPGQWRPNTNGGNENTEAVRFLQELTATVGKHHPHVAMIAEESSAWPGVTARTEQGGLGFGLKWNLGWMHDTLHYLGVDPIGRAARHSSLLLPTTYAANENYLLPLSHDEVVHGKGSLWAKMPGDNAQKAANLRALFGYMWAFPGKQLLFMGDEFGQRDEWSHEDSLAWDLLKVPEHRGLRHLITVLNRLQRAHPALHELDHEPAGFQLLDNDPDRNVVGFLRRSANGEPVVCLANFSGVTLRDHPVRLPEDVAWRVILNTDLAEFGGAGQDPPVTIERTVTLPALSVIWLTPVSGERPQHPNPGVRQLDDLILGE